MVKSGLEGSHFETTFGILVDSDEKGVVDEHHGLVFIELFDKFREVLAGYKVIVKHLDVLGSDLSHYEDLIKILLGLVSQIQRSYR